MGSLREYETVFVLHPNLEEARVEEEIEGVRQTIGAASGEVLDVERWGRRKLAYTIGKVNEGIYTLVRFRSEPGVVADLERRYRLREEVLRHLTVLSQGPPPAQPFHPREEGVVHVSPPVPEGVVSVAGSGAEVTGPGAAPGTTSDSGISAASEADTEADSQTF